MAVRCLVEEPLEIEPLVRMVSAPDRGAVSTFIGTVRDHHHGKEVVSLEYHCYRAMAEAECARIVDEASARFNVAAVVRHRIGHLSVGEIAVVVACAAPHRGAAFDGVRWLIDEVKLKVPIWKLEHYADGTSAWVDPTNSTAATR